MKTLALALLVPVVMCTACGKKEDSLMAPAPADATTQAPAPAPAPPPAGETANAGATGTSAAGSAAASGAAPAQGPATAEVELMAAPGSSVKGHLTLAGEGGAVSFRGVITGLAPGKEHGFHVHEGTECALPDFQSAGGHFNPTKAPHGGPKSGERHLGDIPNIKADKDGHAAVDITVNGVTLVDKDGAPTEILGKTLVVHAMRDDYKTQPSGDSGGRIACGVIR